MSFQLPATSRLQAVSGRRCLRQHVIDGQDKRLLGAAIAKGEARVADLQIADVGEHDVAVAWRAGGLRRAKRPVRLPLWVGLGQDIGTSSIKRRSTRTSPDNSGSSDSSISKRSASSIAARVPHGALAKRTSAMEKAGAMPKRQLTSPPISSSRPVTRRTCCAISAL